ncbi:MAG: hypothetical protein CMH54_01210 [Myxococcales bacterium]|nr:hypothetical protein [Myxococcales bacterium]|tara:strand:+ start:2054 stop:3097 length:1044 start_codon:yes stop_codon:yes gene_type:complete
MKLFSQILMLFAVLGTFSVVGVPSAQAEEDRFGPDIIPAGQAVGSQRVYVVEEGDTLWDIAILFSDDPWDWPLLWSYNPQITNPHWIFPGDTIFLDPPRLKVKRKRLKLEGSRYDLQPKNVRVLANRRSFIPEELLQVSGVIRGSREERHMLAKFDEIYVEFSIPKKIRPNDRYTIFRENREKPIKHPRTGRFLGYPIEFLGELKVLGKEARYSRAVILEAMAVIERGDRVILREALHIYREPTPNALQVDGVISAIIGDGTVTAQHEYVMIDRGTRQGVQIGNRFVILERGDGIREVSKRELRRYPFENIGEAMVIFAYGNHCIAVITRSIRELHNGTRVRMIKGY